MKQQIITYLKLMSRPVKRKELLAYLKNHYEVTDRQMRKAIEEMIHEGELIESSEKGYSLITTQEQLDRAALYLTQKAEAIAIRKNLLIRNFNTKVVKTNNVQLRIDYEAA